MTEPVSIRIRNRERKNPFLVCRNTPVNLLGRNAILGLELKLDCTKQGIDVSGMYRLGVEKGEKWANVYWLGEIDEQIRKQTWDVSGKYIEEQILEATRPKTELHCTMQYDEKQKKLREGKWAEEAGEKQEINSQVIVVGPEGASLEIARH